MARPSDPTLEAIENDLADSGEVMAALGDVARLWGNLSQDTALNILLSAFKAAKRIKTRAEQRRKAHTKPPPGQAAGVRLNHKD